MLVAAVTFLEMFEANRPQVICVVLMLEWPRLSAAGNETDIAQLQRHRHQPFLVAFPEHTQSEVIEVNVATLKRQRFTNPKAVILPSMQPAYGTSA